MVCRLPGPSELLRATGARPEVVTALKDVGMPAGQMCVLWTVQNEFTPTRKAALHL